jgi:hypothetical protein
MQLQAKLMEQRFRLARAEQAIREEDVKAERADKAKQNRELPGHQDPSANRWELTFVGSLRNPSHTRSQDGGVQIKRG